ncbi:hypothetical protein B5X24_HaOG205585 [Helicoverpa armigera]|uniref:Major facilitator superfamily (MFS) profile domain-containing protein n=1 Tax=Helicoverpa armigera TaxID=29058 RepID=A0A2W1BNJ4_HELAM|nr:hypothetical protein B5X24_HaOG205585 [Helicoverpa armigera]
MVVVRSEAGVTGAREEISHDHLFKVTGLSSTNLEKLAQEPEASDFEEAIAATSYGKFNIALMLCTIPAFWSSVSVTSSISYIFTRAQCDMGLSLLDMGTITAMTYGGKWKKGVFCERFKTWCFNGPFAVLISYLAELHRTELRARVILLTSLFYTFANTTLPLLAWAILTKDWDFSIFGDTIESHNLESPETNVLLTLKFLNTKPKLSLSCKIMLAPLFRPPHAKWLFLMCAIHAGCMFGSNTIRLWYPQLAAMISNDAKGLCSAIAPSASPVQVDDICVPIVTDMLTYLQSAAVGAGSVLTYSIGGALVNKCGKRLVSGFCGVASAFLIVLLPFLGTDAYAVVAMVTAALAFTSLCGASLSSTTVDLFPTSLRVMAMATFLMSGRLGTITGTVIFPALIDYGCLPPFITIGSVLAVCGLACFLVPNTTLKKLE